MSNKLSVVIATPAPTFNLVNAGTLKNRLTKLSKDSANNTMSLAFYTMIHGNVQPLGNCDRSIATLLHPVYRQYTCAQFDATKGTWVYSKSKAFKLLKTLGLEFNKSTFEEFVTAIENAETTKQAKIDDAKAQEEALSPTELEAKEKEKVLNYLVRTNLSELQLRDLVLQVESLRSAKAAKSINLKTANA